jgi:hypothetical protein
MKLTSFLFFFFLSLLSLSQNTFNYIDIENDTDFSDFKPIKEEVKKYNFYFSGENHLFSGTNSKLEFKLFKYLNQREGVSNLILEFGEGTGWLVNEFVNRDDKKIEEVINAQFHEDYITFFEKLKEYNKDLDSTEKIVVTGIDLQRSYYIGLEALYLHLPNDSIIPPDSIAREIEVLRFLKGYVRDRAKDNFYENEYSNKSYKYFYGSSYSIPNALKTLDKNFKKYQKDYQAYLGDSYSAYETIFNCLIKAKEFKDYEMERNPYANILREAYMFDKLNKLVDENKNKKFYGQFGRAHISKNRTSLEKYGSYNFASLVSKINSSTKSYLKNKVMSIGIYYINRQDNPYLSIDHETDLARVFKSMKGDKIALENVKDHPDLDSVIKKNHQFVIVHNKSIKKEENSYSSGLFKSGIDFSYGWHDMDLGNINSYFGTNFSSFPLNYWGFSFYAYGQQDVYVDYTFNFYNTLGNEINDTINTSLSGWNGFFNMGYNLTNNQIIDVIPVFGFGYQNMRMEIEEENLQGYTGTEGVTYSINNPAFVLNGRLDVRVRLFQGMGLSLKGGYLLDVSKEDWKYNGDRVNANNKFSGLYWSAGITLGSN